VHDPSEGPFFRFNRVKYPENADFVIQESVTMYFKIGLLLLSYIEPRTLREKGSFHPAGRPVYKEGLWET
jgi:hypothetical protein